MVAAWVTAWMQAPARPPRGRHWLWQLLLLGALLGAPLTGLPSPGTGHAATPAASPAAAPSANPSTTSASASLDRERISLDETVTLTLRASGGSADDAPLPTPALDALERHFRVLGSRRSSRVGGGPGGQFTEWHIELAPRRSGSLAVPPLLIAGRYTPPLLLQVDAAPARERREALGLEVQLQQERVYVQQQLLMTVRILHDGPLEHLQLDDPEPEGAIVRRIGQATFRRRGGDGQQRVHELTYALFPQRPGILEIPPLHLSAIDIGERRRFLDPAQGRLLQRRSEPLRVTVLDIPDDYPDAPWLPARALRLEQQWSEDTGRLRAGQPITRRLTLRADGLLAAQLPALPEESTEGLRHYPERPHLEDDEHPSRGISGSRVQRSALIAPEGGRIRLPPRRVPWWNVEADRLEYAELPGTLLLVAAASAVPQTGTSLQEGSGAGTRTGTGSRGDRLWLELAVLFAGVWILTLLLWVRSVRQRRNAPAEAHTDTHNGPGHHPARKAREARLFRQLQRQLRRHDASASRNTLLHWGRSHCGDPNIDSLAELAQRCQSPALRQAITDMERALWGREAAPQAWRGERLLTVVGMLRRQRGQRSTQGGTGDQDLLLGRLD